MSRSTINTKKKKSTLFGPVGILIGFAVICFMTSMIMNSDETKPIVATLTAEGGIIGPFEVKKDRSVYLIEAWQTMGNRDWSFLQGELLDQNQQYLFGFGKELWHEEGRDSDGRWTEGPTNYDIKMTIQKKGNYFIRFSTEKKSSRSIGEITVRVSQKRGSSLGHFVMGIFCFVGAIAYYLFTGGLTTMLES